MKGRKVPFFFTYIKAVFLPQIRLGGENGKENSHRRREKIILLRHEDMKKAEGACHEAVQVREKE